jgi:hypothetical protein
LYCGARLFPFLSPFLPLGIPGVAQYISRRNRIINIFFEKMLENDGQGGELHVMTTNLFYFMQTLAEKSAFNKGKVGFSMCFPCLCQV